MPTQSDNERLDIVLHAEITTLYKFAQPYVQNKKVLDIACGSGFGSRMLAETANHITGADIKPEILDFARQNYSRHNLQFVIANGEKPIPFDSHTFDVVTSFETIEHIDNDADFLNELKRVIKPGGTLLLSTPNKLVYSPLRARPLNPYHVREYTYATLEKLLSQHFDSYELFGRGFIKDNLMGYQINHHIFRWLSQISNKGIRIIKFLLPTSTYNKLRKNKAPLIQLSRVQRLRQLAPEQLMSFNTPELLTQAKATRPSHFIAVCYKNKAK